MSKINPFLNEADKSYARFQQLADKHGINTHLRGPINSQSFFQIPEDRSISLESFTSFQPLPSNVRTIFTTGRSGLRELQGSDAEEWL